MIAHRSQDPAVNASVYALCQSVLQQEVADAAAEILQLSAQFVGKLQLQAANAELAHRQHLLAEVFHMQEAHLVDIYMDVYMYVHHDQACAVHASICALHFSMYW